MRTTTTMTTGRRMVRTTEGREDSNAGINRGEDIKNAIDRGEDGKDNGEGRRERTTV